MFHTYVANVLSRLHICCNSFQVFHVFFQVFQMHVSNVSSAFIRMLQVLYLDVLKVNRVLHLSSRLLLLCLGISSSLC